MCRLRPIPIPTRTSVSRHARLLMRRSSSHSTTPFSNKTTMVEPPKRTRSAKSAMPLQQSQTTRFTKSKVSKLLPSLHLVAIVNRRHDTSNHHRSDADSHDTTKLRTVNRHDLSYVLAVDVERSTYCLGLETQTCSTCIPSERDPTHVDSIIFSCNVRHWPDRSVYWGVKAMIVLWG